MKHLALLTLFSFSVLISVAQKGKSKNGKESVSITETSNSKPFVLGTIEEIQSKELSEKRTLNIYLPEGYNPNDSIKYPVIYLLDGSADEDFIHIVGLVQFFSFEWINQLPKSIVVGVANVDRKRDFTFASDVKPTIPTPNSGHSDKFISFIEKELQPFIENKYHTNTDKTIIGQSLGGLLATEVLLKKPTLFNKYIIISPSLWWDNGSLLEFNSTILSESSTQQTDIYIAVGKEGITPTKIPRVMEVDANLLADKLKKSKSKSVNVFFDYLPLENHATIMHQAVMNSFQFLYPTLQH
ncbi:alpha/beta hydrolase [Fluviicola taffensis]|uniref:Esterase n=1 Tax=Fluviicola taffensis (strain DSM 16823 / NCIMB 13979 / RW262) TaxID=755732 RepID=F2IB07_FLUTR|nr:alpha/beta hydrolase-fold protein [Fluviicola taffensis]AEA45331.1 esterase [Fluviicola taffensis DSM 16823]